MDTLTKKTLTTKRGYTYTYYVSPAAEGKPTLLLQHGFPDSAAEWEGLIVNHLRPAGYCAIAPDMLGYAGTAKPTDPAAYKFSGMAADLAEILDAEGVAQVISLGHDWGSRMAQLFYNLQPERVTGLVMANVAYSGASADPFNLDLILAKTTHVFGYGLFWYWKVFVAEGGVALLDANTDLLFDILHAPQTWRETLCSDGGLRKAIEARGEGFDLQTRPYATPEMKTAFVERFARDGFAGPVNWYKSHVQGHQDGEPNPANAVVKVPSLYVGYDNDAVCRKETIFPTLQAGLLPQLTNVTLEGGHWGLLDNPKAFGETITEWLSKNY